MSVDTTAPFWQAPLCAFCGAALIGSEIRERSCGHCGRRSLTPSVAAPTGKPNHQGLVSSILGRWGRRRSLAARLRIYRVAR